MSFQHLQIIQVFDGKLLNAKRENVQSNFSLFIHRCVSINNLYQVPLIIKQIMIFYRILSLI